MNRTLKQATVKRYHYDDHSQLQAHLAAFLAAYNFAKRLKTLKGLTPYEYLCKMWIEKPQQFTFNPTTHLTAGLYTQSLTAPLYDFLMSRRSLST